MCEREVLITVNKNLDIANIATPWYTYMIMVLLALGIFIMAISVPLYLHYFKGITQEKKAKNCKNTIIVFSFSSMVIFLYFIIFNIIRFVFQLQGTYYSFFSVNNFIVPYILTLIAFPVFFLGFHAMTFFMTDRKNKKTILAVLIAFVILLFLSFYDNLLHIPNIDIGRKLVSESIKYLYVNPSTEVFSIVAAFLFCIILIIISHKKSVTIESKNKIYPLKTYSQHLLLAFVVVKLTSFILGAIHTNFLPYGVTDTISIVIFYLYPITDLLIYLAYFIFGIEILYNFRLVDLTKTKEVEDRKTTIEKLDDYVKAK